MEIHLASNNFQIRNYLERLRWAELGVFRRRKAAVKFNELSPVPIGSVRWNLYGKCWYVYVSWQVFGIVSYTLSPFKLSVLLHVTHHPYSSTITHIKSIQSPMFLSLTKKNRWLYPQGGPKPTQKMKWHGGPAHKLTPKIIGVSLGVIFTPIHGLYGYWVPLLINWLTLGTPNLHRDATSTTAPGQRSPSGIGTQRRVLAASYQRSFEGLMGSIHSQEVPGWDRGGFSADFLFGG